MKNKNKIRIILLIVLVVTLFLITIFGYINIFLKEKNRENYSNDAEAFYEENKEPVFEIEKIILYNSATAKDNSDGKLKNIDISQFTDIEIFINNTAKIKELTPENTINQLYIDNIKIDSKSDVGEDVLNYKNPYSCGKYQELQNYDNKRIFFEILNSNNKNKAADYEKPVFYTDCSNPISLGFINKDILKNCEVQNTGALKFDGSMLKVANINLKDLYTTISFTLHLINNYNEEFVTNIILDIDLEKEDSPIYTGYSLEILNKDHKAFLKVNKK